MSAVRWRRHEWQCRDIGAFEIRRISLGELDHDEQQLLVGSDLRGVDGSGW